MKVINKTRKLISQKFVENHPVLVKEMQNYNRVHGRISSVLGRCVLIGKLYFKYVILKKNPVVEKIKTAQKKKIPEALMDSQLTEEDILGKIKECEIVLFDAFSVLFYLALDEKQLLSLYEVIGEYPGISDYIDDINDLNTNQKKFLEEIWFDFCLDNKFMHKIWNKAKEMNKQVYIYNNSNLSNLVIENLMEKYLYEGMVYDNQNGNICYITQKPKNNNDLKYKNVNILGEGYRPFYEDNVIVSLYNQIVNLKFHSGENKNSIFYEYGFSCGGILTYGFCQFLGELALREKIDKFLFVARDGDIIRKIFEQYFYVCDSLYLIFSRFASYELLFEDFPEEYIDKNIKDRITRKECDNSIGNILKECGITFIDKYLQEEKLTTEDTLTYSNYSLLKKIIINHKKEVQNSFDNTCKAAKKYYLDAVDGCNKVCVVDLGWHGKSVIYLKFLLEEKYGWTGEVTGALVGATGDLVTQNHIRVGNIKTYAFDNEFWRKTGMNNGIHMSFEEIICIEALFSSKERTLLRYELDKNGNVKFIFGKENKNGCIISEIHNGVMDFVKEFAPVVNKYHLKITSRDAYTPLDYAMQNPNYVNSIYSNYLEEPNAINGFN